MRQVAAAVCIVLTATLVFAADKVDPPAGQVLLFPGGKTPARMRLEIAIDGQSPVAAWEAFLDRLFDYFDRDGDGSLSRAEVARMFPLPLPGGKELTIDFSRLDAN